MVARTSRTTKQREKRQQEAAAVAAALQAAAAVAARQSRHNGQTLTRILLSSAELILGVEQVLQTGKRALPVSELEEEFKAHAIFLSVVFRIFPIFIIVRSTVR